MLNKKILHYILIFILLTSYNFISINNLHAQNSSAYNDVRNVTGANCNAEIEDITTDDGNTITPKPCYTSKYEEDNYRCIVGDILFDPFNSKDLDWNYGNEACIGYIAGAGIALQMAFAGCRVMCPLPTTPENGNKTFTGLFERVYQSQLTQTQRTLNTVKSAASGPGGAQSVFTAQQAVIDPFTIIELGIFASRCATIVESPQCCPAFALCTAAYGIAIGVLGGIFETAKNVFHNVRICGEGHKVFVKDSASEVFSKTMGPYGNFLKKCFNGETTNTDKIDFGRCNLNKSYDRFCEANQGINGDVPQCSNKFTREISNQFYREYLFKGIEYEDNGTGACTNPNWEDIEILLGYKGGNQRYYFSGSQEAPNFACNRFLIKGTEDAEGLKAYECCNQRSQETTCLERFDDKHKNNYQFCSMNKNCSVSFDPLQPAVKYKVVESEASQNYICAKTYSVCPYDHNVGGGTDYADVFQKRPSITTNFCQYMRHCIKRPPISKYGSTDLASYFFAESCKDLIGDSQFINGLDTLKFSPIKSRNFSAPIVQCLKESLENNFMGNTGNYICKDRDSTYVASKGKCISKSTKQETDILYGKGQKIKESIFQKIQNQLRFVIKFCLIFSVLFFGMQILMATPEMYINKKTIITFIIKIGLVSFFALGNAWQGFFIDSVMNISTEISNITFQPKSINDGCNFPKYDNQELKRKRDGESIKKDDLITTKPSYPLGKNYLRIWDTLDCKLARAIGYGPEVNTSNLAKMIFAGFLSGPIGITFFFAAFAYAFILISIILRAIHITIMSLLGVILLIYISPITISCALFERTKGIFENWWKQLLGFILQPMILFAYLGLLLTIFDYIFIGDAKFISSVSGYDLPTLSCDNWSEQIKNPDQSVTTITKEPMNNSIYCIFNFPKFKNYTGLELFDLAIPILTSLDKNKINTIFKAAILMFVFFNFLDKITSLARKLVGGAELKANPAPDLKGKLQKFAKGVQTRALNATSKYASKGVAKAKSTIQSRSSKNDNIPMGSKKGDSGKDKSDMVGGDK